VSVQSLLRGTQGPRHRATSTRRVRNVSALTVAAAFASVGTVVASLSIGGTASASGAVTTVALSDATDAYVSYAAPHQNYGASVRIAATNRPHDRKVAYLRFAIPDALIARVQSAHLILTRDTHHLSGTVSVSAVANVTWSQASLTAANAPTVGRLLASVSTSAATDRPSFDVLSAVRNKSQVALAVTSGSRTDVARFNSREAATGRPQLVLGLSSPPVSPSTTSAVPSTTTASSASTTASAPSTTASSASSTPPVTESTTIQPPSSSTVPVPAAAFFGDTPRGYSDAAGVSTMDANYGPANVVRLFWSGTAGVSPAPDRRVVGSIKTINSGTAAWASTMWRWTYQHEIDSKIKKGLMTLPEWRAGMDSLVALNVPGLSVVLTADAFVNPTKNPSDYLVPGVTHLGVDFDGISQSTGYHDYSRELAAVQAFTQAHGLTWGVAEFGANRASNDPDGSVRAAWLQTWGGRFAAAGAEYVCLWENNSQTGSTFTTAAENAAVRELFTR
jgi:hypothetical protein